MRIAVIIGAVWFQAISFLIPQGDINQLTKLPSLYQHYSSHQLEEGDTSFTDFIVLHYSPDSEHSDPLHHTNLPFFHTAITGMFMPTFFQVMLTPYTVSEKQVTSIYQNFYHFEFVKTNLQPPRLS